MWGQTMGEIYPNGGNKRAITKLPANVDVEKLSH